MKVTPSYLSSNEILIRISLDSPPPANDNDTPVPFPFGLERNAARRLIRGGLPTFKAGRKQYARRADLADAFAALTVASKTPTKRPIELSLAADDAATPKRGRK